MESNQSPEAEPSSVPDEQEPLLGGRIAKATSWLQWGWEHFRAWLKRPSCGWIAILIMMAGTTAVNVDGGVVQSAFPTIAAFYGQQRNAAWLTALYPLVFILLQPMYTAATRRFNWAGPLILAYGIFIGGLLICAQAKPSEIQQRDGLGGMSPLVIGRVVVAGGASAMGYLPSIVLNGMRPAACLLAFTTADLLQELSKSRIEPPGSSSRPFAPPWAVA